MHFGFATTDIENLALELAKPIASISVRCMKHGQPMTVTLWRLDGTGLEISSEVHDVAERLEIGNLRFAWQDGPAEADQFFPETQYPSPLSTANQLNVVKLTITESGSSAEGGIILSDESGKSIAILAAAYPYCVAITGVSPEMDKFASEYLLTEYRREPLSNPA